MSAAALITIVRFVHSLGSNAPPLFCFSVSLRKPENPWVYATQRSYYHVFCLKKGLDVLKSTFVTFVTFVVGRVLYSAPGFFFLEFNFFLGLVGFFFFCGGGFGFFF